MDRDAFRLLVQGKRPWMQFFERWHSSLHPGAVPSPVGSLGLGLLRLLRLTSTAGFCVDSHMVVAGRAVMPVPEGVQSHDNSLRKRFQMRLSKSDEKGIARAYSRLVDADRLAFLGCSIYNGPRWQPPGPSTGCAACSGT